MNRKGDVMWRYYLEDNKIKEAILARIKYQNSEKMASRLLSSLGYDQEIMTRTNFDDLIFTEGSMDETFSSEEIRLSEGIGDIFVSRGKDMFDFFLIDVNEEHQTDAKYIGSFVKIINKAFKGNNIIIFQNENKLMFGSRYVSRLQGRDYHFTYWISDVSTIKDFSSYNICKKNSKYSYALYMSMVCQLSLFHHRWWSDIKEEADELDINFIKLTRELSFIVSRQFDSFELLDKAMQASEFISTDAKMREYREDNDSEDDEEELYENADILYELLRE